jgi:hypothetical protein
MKKDGAGTGLIKGQNGFYKERLSPVSLKIPATGYSKSWFTDINLNHTFKLN